MTTIPSGIHTHPLHMTNQELMEQWRAVLEVKQWACARRTYASIANTGHRTLSLVLPHYIRLGGEGGLGKRLPCTTWGVCTGAALVTGGGSRKPSTHWLLVWSICLHNVQKVLGQPAADRGLKARYQGIQESAAACCLKALS